MDNKVTLIKFGGSVITNKEQQKSINKQVLTNLLTELQAVKQQFPDRKFILGHGSGSFAHYPAKKYDTAHGFRDEESPYGMAVTQNDAAELNRIVVQNALELKLPAVSWYVSNTVLLNSTTIKSSYIDVIEEYLIKDLLPVVTGDVLVDQKQGCSIWSADTILPFLGKKLVTKNWQVNRLIHVTATPGVYRDVNDSSAGIFNEINSDNFSEVKKAIGKTSGVDVTGGMLTKLKESIDLAEQGIESIILSGGDSNNFRKAMLDDSNVIGTKITS